jgi:hypothetical protein
LNDYLYNQAEQTPELVLALWERSEDRSLNLA